MPNDYPASVTTIWRNFVSMRQISNKISGHNLRPEDALHPADYLTDASLSLLPAVLALPARSDEEAMMQLCALAELVTVQADSESGELNESVNLWRAGLASILNAMSGDECLSRCLDGMGIADLLGTGALEDARGRLARIDERAAA